jgi:hypothetical protein
MNNDMEDKRQIIRRRAGLRIWSLHRKVWPLRLYFIVCLFAYTIWATGQGLSFTTTHHLFLSYFWKWINDTNTQHQSIVKVHHVPTVTAVYVNTAHASCSIHVGCVAESLPINEEKTCSRQFTYAIFGFKRNLHNHVERVDLSGGVPSTTRWGMSVGGRGHGT